MIFAIKKVTLKNLIAISSREQEKVSTITIVGRTRRKILTFDINKLHICILGDQYFFIECTMNIRHDQH